MALSREDLLGILQELGDEDIERFKFYLRQKQLGRAMTHPGIPQSSLEKSGADVSDPFRPLSSPGPSPEEVCAVCGAILHCHVCIESRAVFHEDRICSGILSWTICWSWDEASGARP